MLSIAMRARRGGESAVTKPSKDDSGVGAVFVKSELSWRAVREGDRADRGQMRRNLGSHEIRSRAAGRIRAFVEIIEVFGRDS